MGNSRENLIINKNLDDGGVDKVSMLEWIQKWYISNCDGNWEHIYGINIYTLDNPGWSVNIELFDTDLEYANFETIQKYTNDNNWVHCSVADGVFKGSGSADKLEEILKIFSEWATTNKKSD